MMGDRIALLRPGGRLAQYDTPDAILAAPADDFVASFVGGDRGLKRLSLTRLDEVELEPLDGVRRPGPRRLARPCATRSRLMLTEGTTFVVVLDDDRQAARHAHPRMRSPRGSPRDRRRAQTEPVIPDFGEASDCVQENRLFCPEWVRRQLGRRAPAGAPPARQADRDRRRGRLRDRLRRGARRPPAPQPSSGRSASLSALLYTIPSLALFQLLVPIDRPDGDDGRGRARLLHPPDPVPEHPRRTARDASRTCSKPRGGWG